MLSSPTRRRIGFASSVPCPARELLLRRVYRRLVRVAPRGAKLVLCPLETSSTRRAPRADACASASTRPSSSPRPRRCCSSTGEARRKLIDFIRLVVDRLRGLANRPVPSLQAALRPGDAARQLVWPHRSDDGQHLVRAGAGTPNCPRPIHADRAATRRTRGLRPRPGPRAMPVAPGRFCIGGVGGRPGLPESPRADRRAVRAQIRSRNQARASTGTGDLARWLPDGTSSSLDAPTASSRSAAFGSSRARSRRCWSVIRRCEAAAVTDRDPPKRYARRSPTLLSRSESDPPGLDELRQFARSNYPLTWSRAPGCSSRSCR